jgi:hypothetical protein
MDFAIVISFLFPSSDFGNEAWEPSLDPNVIHREYCVSGAEG